METNDAPAGFTCDKILKSVLADPLLIEQILRYYVCDEECADELDYSTLQQLPTEHIDPSLGKYYYSDLIWQVSYHDTSRKPIAVVILLELQSTSSYIMVLRVLNYMVQFYLNWEKKYGCNPAHPLPYVLPIVIYTGFRVWNGPLDIGDLLPKYPLGIWKEPSPLQFKMKLLWLARLDSRGGDESLAAKFVECLRDRKVEDWRAEWRATLGLLKKLGRAEMRDAWARLFMMAMKRNEKGAKMSLAQLLQEEVYPQVTTEELEKEFGPNAPDLEGLQPNGDIIPYGARMINKGRAEGLIEGRAEGMAEGRAKGMAKTVAKMVALRYAACPQAIVDSIDECTDQEYLEKLLTALATTNTYEEFLQGSGLG